MARLLHGQGEDGIKKTPEWAAPICAVPAETIREFARLYGTTKPVHLQYFYSCAKRHMGDYSASASMLLQAMTGNIACAGGCQTGACLPTPGRVPAPRADFGRDPGDYRVPVLFNNNCLTEVLACQKDYWEGRMDESDVPPPHRLAYERRPAAERPDDHIREQLRQQPLER